MTPALSECKFNSISVLITILIIGCGQPALSPRVSVIANTGGTTEGDTVTLQCEDGLFPMESVMINCNSAGVWSPNPAEFICMVISGIIYIERERENFIINTG